MHKLVHCGELLEVLEVFELHPDDAAKANFPGIIKQVLIYSFCLGRSCQCRRQYGWIPVFKDRSSGEIIPIKTRKFDNDWLPRFQTDRIKEAKSTRGDKFIGAHTDQVHYSTEHGAHYLAKKDQFSGRLRPLPAGVKAKDIYDGTITARARKVAG